MKSLLIEALNGKDTDRPPIWFMRQAGRILPSYMKLKETYSFHELMNDRKLASKVTLLPIKDLEVDAAILFSDILVIPNALGLDLEFKKTGPIFNNPINELSKPSELIFNPNKLDYIYNNIEQVISDKDEDLPLIGFCGGPLTVFLFMFKGEGVKDFRKNAIKYLYSNRKESVAIMPLLATVPASFAMPTGPLKLSLEIWPVTILPSMFKVKTIILFVSSMDIRKLWAKEYCSTAIYSCN